MEIKKLIQVGLLSLCPFVSIFAQDAGDLATTTLQLSTVNPGGSARIIGLGGAQTALGGDISSVFSNPAGIGFFNKSQFSFSPQFQGFSTSTRYLGDEQERSGVNVNLANIGAVFGVGSSRGKWRGNKFGISINRVVDFQERISYIGNNANTDLIDYGVETDNFFSSDALSDLLFETSLTDEFFVIYNGDPNVLINGKNEKVSDLFNNPNIGDTLFFIDRNIYKTTGGIHFPRADSLTRQSEVIDSKGAVYQTSFAYGANYDDRLYIGANVGIMTLNREVTRTYTETPSPGVDLNQITLTDDYTLSGIGISSTLGIIVRPADQILIGLTYVTPTVYSIEQTRELELTADFNGFPSENKLSPILETSYTVKTPSRLKGGITGFIGKHGFITAEVENVKYSGGKLSGSDESYEDENRTINRYESVLNYRVGAEARFSKFRARAGYYYLSDPVKNDFDQSLQGITFGGGIKTKNYSVDLAVANQFGGESTVSPYIGAPTAIASRDNLMITVSAGFSF